MADEHAVTTPVGPKAASTRPAEAPQTHGPATAHPPRRDEAHHETSARGILKDAIQKVMEEIEYHEREAQKHRQQAEALKRDLRESFAFMQEQKGRGKPIEAPAEKATEAKKKPAGGKGKKG